MAGSEIVKFRLAKDEDMAKVIHNFHKKFNQVQSTFGDINVEAICELSLYCVVGIDVHQKVVAFGALDDHPSLPPNLNPPDQAMHWAIQEASDLGFLTESVLWLRVCVSMSDSIEHKDTLSKQTLRALFSVSPTTQVILHIGEYTPKVLQQSMKTLSCSKQLQCSFRACVRSEDFPAFKVRRAITDEADNLVPLIERSQKKGLPLTDLPPSSHPDHPHALARLISVQNKRDHVVFVAEVELKVVGLMSVTANIDLNSLNRNFDLDDFNNLVPKDHAKKKRSKKATLVIPEDDHAAEAEEFNAESEPPPMIPDTQSLTEISLPPLDSNAKDSAATESDSPSANISTSDHAQEKVQFMEERKIVIPPLINNNLFQVTMLMLDEDYQSHYIDFLLAAFKQQEKDYCMVALPYISPFHPMLHLFTRVLSRPNPKDLQRTDIFSSNKTSLYLLHQNGLSPGFEIRHSKSVDANGVAELLETFPDRSAIVDLVLKPYKGCVTTVAVMGMQIVGFAWLQDGVPLEVLHTHFEIDALVATTYHPKQQHAVLLLYVLSPIFRARSRLFLRETMRLMTKTVVYYPIFPHQELPEHLLEDFLLVSGKRQPSMLPPCSWGHVVDQQPSKLLNSGNKDATTVSNAAKLHVKHEDSAVKTLPSKPPTTDSKPPVTDSIKDLPSAKSKVSIKASPAMDVKVESAKSSDLLSSKVLLLPSSATPVKDPVGSHSPASNSQEKKGSKIIESLTTNDVQASAGNETDAITRRSKVLSILNPEPKFVSSHKSESSDLVQPGLLRGQFFGFECTLYLTSKKFVGQHKAVINSRIVVIGASRAAASFLHTLMLSTTMWFINLTLISTNGFARFQGAAAEPNCSKPSSPSPLEFDPGPSEPCSKLGLDCGVKFIKGIAEGIDRKQKIISLLTQGNHDSTSSVVPYDWLILATGLQDQTRHALGLCTVTHGLKGVIRAQELVEHRHELGLGIASTSVYAKAYVGWIVVYGLTLEAFCALQILLEEGKRGSDLFLIYPETDPLENLESSCLKDAMVARQILGYLKSQGVHVIHSKKLVAIHLNKIGDWVDSLTFTHVIKKVDPGNIAKNGLHPYSKSDNRGEHVQFLRTSSSSEDLVESLISESYESQSLHKTLPPSQAPISTVVRVRLLLNDTGESIARVELIVVPVDENTFEEEQEPPILHQPCSLLVTCDERQVDLHLFQAINKAGMLYNGRVIVDGFFQTSDNSIFATGSVAKFSRKCCSTTHNYNNNLQMLDKFCSKETGKALAETIMFKLLTVPLPPNGKILWPEGLLPGLWPPPVTSRLKLPGSDDSFTSSKQLQQLPSQESEVQWPRPCRPGLLYKPKVVGGIVLGNMRFLSVTSPNWWMLTDVRVVKTLKTKFDAHKYCRVDVLPSGDVARFIYFGSAEIKV